MKVFITGIAGFIGFHLAKSLASQGHTVFGIDNGVFRNFTREIPFKYYSDLKLARIENLKKSFPDIEIIRGDIQNIHYRDIFEGVDLVVHLAALANPRQALENPFLYIESNIEGTQVLIQEMEKAEVPLVLYASSSSIMYGQKVPWKESEPINHLTNPYSWSKFVNECQFDYSSLNQTVGLRFFTAYGPWGRPDMALYSFADGIVSGKEMKLYNYGNMWRDFTYIDDIIQGVNCVIAHTRASDDKKLRDIYNIGYGKKVFLRDFTEALEKHLDKKGKWELVPPHPADAPVTWSDTSKIQKIGYNPTTPIDEGIKKFVEWYKEYHNV